MIATRGDMQGRSTRSQVHVRERIAHILRRRPLSPIVGVAKPELTATIRAPALDAAINEEGAHVIRIVGTTGYLHHRACSRAHLNELGREATAPRMVAPAPEIGLIIYGAPEGTVGADLDGLAALAEVNFGQVVTHLAWLVADLGVGRIPIRLAKPLLPVVAEALDVAVVQQDARVTVARCDLDRVAAGPEADERQRIAHLIGGIPTALGVAVADVSASAEALETAGQCHLVLNDGARLIAAGGDLYGPHIRPQVDRLHIRSQQQLASFWQVDTRQLPPS